MSTDPSQYATPPASAPGGFDHATAYRNPGNRTWNPWAISSFVLSILGCTVLGALLGLILSIPGIAGCRRGRRKGMGLAIAAIPISLITGTVGIVIGMVFWLLASITNMAEAHVPVVFGTNGVSVDDGTTRLETLLVDSSASDRAPTAVTEWLTSVRREHGTLASFTVAKQNPFSVDAGANLVARFQGQFVNGPAVITITFDGDTIMTEPRIVDISVDGVALQGSDGLNRDD